MKKRFFDIPAYIWFIISALLVIFLFPGDRRYGDRISEEEERREQELFLQSFKPIFRLDTKVAAQQTDRAGQAIGRMDMFDTDAYRTLISRLLRQAYQKGIVNIADYLFLQENHADSITVVIDSRNSETRAVEDVFTPKSAYSFIYINMLNDSYLRPEQDELKNLNLNEYLTGNLVFDQAATDRARENGLQSIARRKHIQRQYGYISGVSLLTVAVMACFFFFFYYIRPKIYRRPRDLFFLLLMATIFILLTEISLSMGIFSIYIIPYAIIPIVVRTFFDSRTAQMTHLATVMICSLMAAAPFDFLIIQIAVCMVAIYALKDLTRRSELIRCAFFILGAYALIYAGLLLFRDGDFSAGRWSMLLWFAINFIFVMFAYPLIYMIEKLFGYISNVTLVELSDINSPALRKLSELCPGTFQHSLQVSMLGAAAAPLIGANPQLIRTGALYHDLGKMNNPRYFIENVAGGPNPHDSLQPEESARILTAHVPDGVKIAEKYNLPPAIVRFIRTHHGRGKTKYFYNTFRNRFPDLPVNEAAFTYDGENPDTRETALLMMADSVEAASRSLTDYSEASLRALIDRIIDGQIADRLLDRAPLTFRNIADIKRVFLERLLSVYHLRITYPEADKKQ